jgi:hypothetical protein
MRLTTTQRQIIHDALQPRIDILGKRIINADDGAIDPSDVEEFNNLAIILSKLGRGCHYNIFVKANGNRNLYYSKPAPTGFFGVY